MQFTRRYFDPARHGDVDVTGVVTVGSGQTPGDVYIYSPKVVLAANIALATQRPLLVSGEPGSGKTTLARNIARVLGWWFYRETVTSRTTAADLKWTFDTLRRLSDAHEGQVLRDRRYYVEPGVLWWALDPGSARQRGTRGIIAAAEQAHNRGEAPSAAATDTLGAVVLLDEIDKADPDVPNDLLEPFDSGTFTVHETADPVARKRQDLLLMMTTNGERELPQAFLRRCVTLSLDDEPTAEWLARIARRRYGADDPRMAAVARDVVEWRARSRTASVRPPGTAEFLDAYRVCVELDIDPQSPTWQDVARSVLWKQEKAPPAAQAPA